MAYSLKTPIGHTQREIPNNNSLGYNRKYHQRFVDALVLISAPYWPKCSNDKVHFTHAQVI